MEAHLEASKGVNVACAIVAFVLSMTLERLVIWSFVPVYGSVPVYSAFSASWMVTHELIFIAFALCALSVRRLFPVGYLLGYKIWCGIVLMSAALLLTLERPGLFRSSRNTIDIHIIHFFVSAFEGLLGVIWILLPFDSSPELLGQYTVAHRILAGNIIFQDVRSYTLLTLFAIRAMLWYGIRQDQLAVGIGWFREHVPSIATVNRSLLQFVVLGLLKLTVSRILHSTGRHVLFAATVFLALGAYCSSLHGVNVVLGKHNFVIRDRLESNTGYLSVLENTETGLRVLRHDHSLLGGVWLLTPERRRQGLQVEESVYSVFYMLEAVKLMEVEGKTNAAGSSSPLNALFM